MPKDNIDDLVTDGFRIEVSWRPDGDVQIASVNTHSTLTLDEEPTAGTTSSALTPTPFNGWHVTLDRYRVNRLIKSLRTARDQAFGRDE